jgi:hypothetical protein
MTFNLEISKNQRFRQKESNINGHLFLTVHGTSACQTEKATMWSLPSDRNRLVWRGKKMVRDLS